MFSHGGSPSGKITGAEMLISRRRLFDRAGVHRNVFVEKGLLRLLVLPERRDQADPVSITSGSVRTSRRLEDDFNDSSFRFSLRSFLVRIVIIDESAVANF